MRRPMPSLVIVPELRAISCIAVCDTSLVTSPPRFFGHCRNLGRQQTRPIDGVVPDTRLPRADTPRTVPKIAAHLGLERVGRGDTQGSAQGRVDPSRFV